MKRQEEHKKDGAKWHEQWRQKVPSFGPCLASLPVPLNVMPNSPSFVGRFYWRFFSSVSSHAPLGLYWEGSFFSSEIITTRSSETGREKRRRNVGLLGMALRYRGNRWTRSGGTRRIVGRTVARERCSFRRIFKRSPGRNIVG